MRAEALLRDDACVSSRESNKTRNSIDRRHVVYGLMLPQDQRMKIHLIALRLLEEYLRSLLNPVTYAATFAGKPDMDVIRVAKLASLARHAEGAGLLFEAASYFLKARCFCRHPRLLVLALLQPEPVFSSRHQGD